MSLPLPPQHAEVDAFVLAGGSSRRMGRDKALIEFAGVPLIEHSLGIFRGAGLKPRIAGIHSDLSSFAPVIPDDPRHSGGGPLSGVCSALAANAAQLSVFLPVDLPLIPADLISYLVHYATTTASTVTVVSVAGFVQTFPAVIDRIALSPLLASLSSNDRKCLTAFRLAADCAPGGRLSVPSIEFLLQAGTIHHPANIPPAQWFLNVNTPREFARLESRHLASASSVPTRRLR